MPTRQNSTTPLDTTLEETQQRLATLFVQLCGDPDDRAVAEGADEALRRLDALLTAGDDAHE